MGLIFGRSDTAIKMWREAKKKFETETGKKKPSEKLAGAIRLSSGLESALDSLDQIGLKVWDAKTQKDFDKARADYLKGADKLMKATVEYVKVLEKAAEGSYKDYKPAVEKLRDELLKQVSYLCNKMNNRNGFKPA